MLMKALQVVRPHSFDLVEVPAPQLPTVGNDYVLIRTSWVSMCGSDIPFFTGNKRFRSYPMAPGAPIHESVGEVVESASSLFRAGDRVLSIPEGDLGLAEYFLAQASKTIPLNSDIGDPGAACIIQPLSTVINAVDRLGDLRGKSFSVIGLGSIGLLFCWLLKNRGARTITGIDPLPGRCRMAETLGATRTIASRSIAVVHETRRSPEKWDAPDICIEAVGHQMETVNDCLELVCKYGTVVAFGVPDQPVYALEYEVFFRKNAVLMGTVTPDWKEYLLKAQNLFVADQDAFSELVTHRLSIREAEKAFRMYERHEDGIIKAIMDANSW